MAAPFDVAQFLAKGGLSSQDRISSLQNWQKTMMAKIVAANPNDPTIGVSGHLPINRLPFEEQVKAMGEFRRLSGLEDVLAHLGGAGSSHADQVANIGSRLEFVGKVGDGYHRFPAASLDPVNQLFSGFNLGYKDKPSPRKSGLLNPKVSALPGHSFTTGVTSIPMLDDNRLSMPRRMRQGASYTSFDIETASLQRHNMREMSYHSGTVGVGGDINLSRMSSGKPTYFRPRAFARGSMGMDQGDGKIVPTRLERFMSVRYGQDLASLPTTNLGDDFAERMMPFLDTALKSDYMVGHNILGFDVPHIFTSLMNTKRYGKDDEFRSLVDRAHAHIKATAVDTLVLARSAPNLADMPLAPELKALGENKKFGIENILLTTDLGERIGKDKMAELMNRGLHFGDVDDYITMSLYKHMDDLQLNPSGLDPVHRTAILNSGAITPITNIRNPADIADVVKKRMRDVGVSNINPIEHEAVATRKMSLGLDRSDRLSRDNLAFRNNVFQRAAAEGEIGVGRMRGVQNQLAKRGMPWAGLSLEERMHGSNLARITSTVNPRDKILNKLNNDTLTSTFEAFSPASAGYETYSGRSSIPQQLLRSAGIIEDGDTPLLRTSVVAPTKNSPRSRVNLVYDFKEGQHEQLAKYVEDLTKNDNYSGIAQALGLDITGMTEDQIAGLAEVENLRTAVKDRGLLETLRDSGERGVAIGQLQPDHAEPFIDELKRFSMQDVPTDTNQLHVRYPLMAMNEKYVQTTGAVLTRHASAEELAQIPLQVEQARKANSAYKAVTTDSPFLSKIAQFDAQFGGEKVTQRAAQVYDSYQNVRRHIPKAVGLIGAAAVGMHLYGRHKEKMQYQETMDQMPYEENGYSYRSADYLQENIDMGINKGYQRYDPLSTAYVVDNLNSNKINHTAMNYDKNNVLYGGVL